jgi:ABC-type tungstate transport system substrate-binding protein
MKAENKKSMTELLRKISKQDIRNTMAMTWMVLTFILVFKLLNAEIPPGNKDILNAVTGVVVGQLVVIIGYYFTQSKTEVDQQKKENEDK